MMKYFLDFIYLLIKPLIQTACNQVYKINSTESTHNRISLFCTSFISHKILLKEKEGKVKRV